MTRSVCSRALALFLGVWFVAVSAGPELSHACPTHGHAAMAAVMRGVHAGATTAPMNHANGQSSTVPQPHHSNQCTCLGHCCSAPPVALVGITMAIAGVVTVATRDAGLPDYAYVPVAAQHVLPLANGPPLAA